MSDVATGSKRGRPRQHETKYDKIKNYREKNGLMKITIDVPSDINEQLKLIIRMLRYKKSFGRSKWQYKKSSNSLVSGIEILNDTYGRVFRYGDRFGWSIHRGPYEKLSYGYAESIMLAQVECEKKMKLYLIYFLIGEML